jgi:hypothetical protein
MPGIRRPLLALLMTAAATLPGAPAAQAACAADPDALTFHQMIEQEQTGDQDYDVIILGKAIRIRDAGGGRGGTTIAKLAVAATPAGSAPLLTRVYFYREPPGVQSSENFEFHRGRWYVVIAAHRGGGGFDFDGPCGRTQGVSHDRFRRLVRLAEGSELGAIASAEGTL